MEQIENISKIAIEDTEMHGFLEIKNHPERLNCIILKIAGAECTVVSEKLIKAIENAKNSYIQ